MFHEIPLPTLLAILTTLGVPGLVLLLSYDTGKRMDKHMLEFQRQTTDILTSQQQQVQSVLAKYRDDMTTITRYYEDNVELVKRYERLSEDLCGVIHMSTQVNTKLVEQIQNNMYCPIIRKEGPRG